MLVLHPSNNNTSGELQTPELSLHSTLAEPNGSLPAQQTSPAATELSRAAAGPRRGHARAPCCTEATAAPSARPACTGSARSDLDPPGTQHVFLVHLLYRSPHRRQSGAERYSGAGSKPNSSRLSAARVARDGGENARRAAAEQGAKERRGKNKRRK